MCHLSGHGMALFNVVESAWDAVSRRGSCRPSQLVGARKRTGATVESFSCVYSTSYCWYCGGEV